MWWEQNTTINVGTLQNIEKTWGGTRGGASSGDVFRRGLGLGVALGLEVEWKFGVYAHLEFKPFGGL